jgi:hypothetical protein
VDLDVLSLQRRARRRNDQSAPAGAAIANEPAGELGRSKAEIARLTEAGVLGS